MNFAASEGRKTGTLEAKQKEEKSQFYVRFKRVWHLLKALQRKIIKMGLNKEN